MTVHMFVCMYCACVILFNSCQVECIFIEFLFVCFLRVVLFSTSNTNDCLDEGLLIQPVTYSILYVLLQSVCVCGEREGRVERLHQRDHRDLIMGAVS